jgi:hypothetical protein
MNSIVQFPQEILLLIIAQCDGLSLERLSRTSKMFNALMHEYIKRASDKELSSKIIPVFHRYTCDDGSTIYNAHFHQLPNAKLHGKFEIYISWDMCYSCYKTSLHTRVWFSRNFIYKCNYLNGVQYASLINLRKPNFYTYTYLFHDMNRELKLLEPSFRRVGIKRKRGQYFHKRFPRY